LITKSINKQNQMREVFTAHYINIKMLLVNGIKTIVFIFLK